MGARVAVGRALSQTAVAHARARTRTHTHARTRTRTHAHARARTLNDARSPQPPPLCLHKYMTVYNYKTLRYDIVLLGRRAGLGPSGDIILI
jgi:hypothetical protein